MLVGGAGVSVFGGAAVGLVGRLVGKFGSVGDFGLVTGVPGVLVWQPVTTTPNATATASAQSCRHPVPAIAAYPSASARSCAAPSPE